ncbi:death domain-containing protein CRADD-like [Haliotis cracherodii]|uniref:death domain-containing protein CRADD-like n=1 Tax=Haliotis cracherodii TaxID=6455 RepID=UPI0039E982DC
MGNIVLCWSGFKYQKISKTDNPITCHYNPQLAQRGPRHWNQAYAVNEEMLDTLVSGRDLSLVASHIGIGFESVGIELGLTLVVIEQVTFSHPCSLYMQVVHMLTKWKERNGRTATSLVLVRALWRCNDRCPIEWEDILNILQGPSTVSV